MNIRHAPLALVLSAFVLTGCSATPRTAPGTTEGRGKKRDQIDEGGYILKNVEGGELGWAFALRSPDEPTMKEYWLKGSNWPAKLDKLIIVRDPRWKSCSPWRKAQCEKPGGVRCSRTIVPAGGSLDSFCKGVSPPPGNTFLWDGEYELTSGVTGRIYVGEGREIWSMSASIGDAGAELPYTGPPGGFSAFKERVCEEQPPVVFEPSSTELPDFCTTPPSDCKD